MNVTALPCVWLLPSVHNLRLRLASVLSGLACRVEEADRATLFGYVPSDMILSAADATDEIRRVREMTDVWLVALCNEAAECSFAAALTAGADACVRLSCSDELLRMQLSSLLRGLTRIHRDGVFRCGALKIDFSARCVFSCGEPIDVTPTEYRLLSLLACHAGQYLTYAHLCRECGVAPAALRVHIASLRKKLHADCILTQAGIGYKMPREIRQ